MSQKVVAVFGVTEGQGSSVVRALAEEAGYKVRGPTPDVSTPQAQQLSQHVSDLVAYDPYDQRSIESALAGAYAVFVNTVTDYNDPDCFENEKLQGRLIAKACREVGVGHVVFSSQLHTTRVSGALVRHMVAKAEIEDDMRDLGLPLTCLIMPIYYEDFCGLFKPVTRDGCNFDLLIPTAQTPLDMISVADLGRIVADVMGNRDKFLHKTVSVSGDKLTVREVATVLTTHLLPRHFHHRQLTVHEFSQLSLPGIRDWAQMFNFLVRVDQRHKVRESRWYNPQLQSFEAWVVGNKDAICRALS
ncbi:hypothetical protein ACOMHN_027715 [Nucella lapillus]